MARILVVDDKDENLSLMEDLLTGYGHGVATARNGAEALLQARSSPPDLIITDILMPVMDGFTLCREWRQDVLLKGKPFVFLTATYTDPKDEEFALRLGADCFLLKPVEPPELMGRIEDLLRANQKGVPTAEPEAGVPPSVLLKQYNEALIRKLEDKLADTEKANKELILYREHLEELVEARTADLKKATQELAKLEELRQNLTDLIVHDMRSPLTVILGTLEQASTEANLSDSFRRNLRTARESARRLTEMTSTLLDLSRMETGEMRLNLGQHDVLELIRSEADVVSILARSKDIRINITGSAAPCLCDAALIKRVVFNLLDNAIKFSPKSGTIDLRVARDEDSVLVSIADSGPGIPDACRERVFDKFFQAEARDLGCSRSSGLGLAMCKMAVEAHNGRIAVENRPEGGACFWFMLPRGAAPIESQP